MLFFILFCLTLNLSLDSLLNSNIPWYSILLKQNQEAKGHIFINLTVYLHYMKHFPSKLNASHFLNKSQFVCVDRFF